jgi:serine O-acetyltransferase
MSLSSEDLRNYVERQLTAFFPDGIDAGDALAQPVERALERVEYCFSRINLKYFKHDRGVRFDHLHTDQYAMFLYMLANTISRDGGDRRLAAKVYALNKALHGVDAFYEVELPKVFAFQHPVGTVLGRGRYGEYFFVYQRCSVGSNLEGAYPTIGEGVVMYGGSAIIGASSVGDNCWLSVGTIVVDSSVPNDSIAFGRSPDLVLKKARRNVVRDIFGRPDEDR